MSSRKDIEFSTVDGLKLRGWLYSAGVKRPTIIMSNGFSGSKEAYLDDFAKRFQAAGYTALAYDNRNWFDSEGSSQMVPITPESIEEVESGVSQAILACPDVFPFLAELDRRGVPWERHTTAQSLFYLQSHDPRAFIHRLSPMPLLMIVAAQDKCISPNSQIEMFSRALEPKKLHVLRGAGHFDVYYGQPFEENISVQLNFLEETL